MAVVPAAPLAGQAAMPVADSPAAPSFSPLSFGSKDDSFGLGFELGGSGPDTDIASDGGFGSDVLIPDVATQGPTTSPNAPLLSRAGFALHSLPAPITSTEGLATSTLPQVRYRPRINWP